MTDARIAFHELREAAGASFDARAMHASLDEVEPRVERSRIGRAVMSAAAVALVAGAAVLAVNLIGGSGSVSPAGTPSATPSANESSSEDADATPAWCHSATVVPGNPVGDLGGFDGWFNGTPDAPCDEWEQQMQDHPDTVWVNTSDNTMIEAYYRTDMSALGVYGTLSGDFEVPDPDPAWPAESAVLIDAQTGEVLASERFDEMDGFDSETGHFDAEEP